MDHIPSIKSVAAARPKQKVNRERQNFLRRVQSRDRFVFAVGQRLEGREGPGHTQQENVLLSASFVPMPWEVPCQLQMN
jgi:hypothetical protein